MSMQEAFLVGFVFVLGLLIGNKIGWVAATEKYNPPFGCTMAQTDMASGECK